MSNLYNDFEKRFTNAWFSSDWGELEVKSSVNQVVRKDVATLQAELAVIKENIESIAQKQLRLANLSRLYSYEINLPEREIK